MKCLCGEKSSFPLFQSGLYDVVQCGACGQVRTAARGKAARTGYYKEEDVTFYVTHEKMFRALFGALLHFIRRYAPGGMLVDIGAGVGLLLDEARKMGYRVIGFEPSKASVAAAKKHFGISLINSEFSVAILKRKGYTLDSRVRGNDKEGRMDDRKWGRDDSVNVVVINHVLEHLKNPKEIIYLCTEILNNSGVLVIGVPNFASFMSRMKRGKWQSLIPEQHRWQFSLKSLDRLVLPYGFRRIAVSYENHDRSMHYWWKRPMYWILDKIALRMGRAEAMAVIYERYREFNHMVTYYHD